MKKTMDNNAAQGSSMFLFLMLFMVLILFVMPTLGPILGVYFGYAFEPLIGFNGQYPILTLLLAGFIVVLFSSLLTNFFTKWKKMGETQEMAKAFQKELAEARKSGNTNRISKLMKMQPEIMQRQMEGSGGMMKPMLFLVVFIFPIFMWLRLFLGSLPHYYFTVPWASNVSLFNSQILFQTWLWLYLVFTFVLGQIIRQALKWVSWSDWWINTKKRLIPSRS
ncbi:MAG: EMC3/TMCO1 family protein [Euryarchaeota archaeon]|nr:EMC3/TMCO1 family protein [Euryarchaeota archaeon]